MRGHDEEMTPPEPANDERPPLWPGMSRRTEERLRWAFSLSVIAVIFGSCAIWLDARHWLTIAITVGIGFVVMLIAGLWRALIGGRS